MNLRLTIELVPKPLWGYNLRTMLPMSIWDTIRRKAYADYFHKCGICEAQGKLNCHEIWKYDDVNHIQKLLGFIALCDLCHLVKHIGFTGIQASKGQLDFRNIVNHFTKVNQCTEQDFNKHYGKAFNLWEIRSTCEWVLDLGSYNHLIKDGRADNE